MKKLAYFILGILLTEALPARPHTLSGERVLVDTDAALDDLMAIALVLRLPGLQVLGVVTCDGSSRADRGAELVQAWLRRLGRQDLQVLAGSSSTSEPPPWRPLYDGLAENLKESATESPPRADWLAEIERLLNAPGDPVTVLALGPLSNLAQLLERKPRLAKRLARIVWYGSPPEDGNLSTAISMLRRPGGFFPPA